MEIDYKLHRAEELRKLKDFFEYCVNRENPDSVAGNFGRSGVFFGNVIQYCSFEIPAKAMEEIYRHNKEKIESDLYYYGRLKEWKDVWDRSTNRSYISPISESVLLALARINCQDKSVTKTDKKTVIDFTTEGGYCKVSIEIKKKENSYWDDESELTYSINGKAGTTYWPSDIISKLSCSEKI